MEKVTQKLTELKEEIISTESVDETAEPLTGLIKDIDLVLGNPGEFPFAQNDFVQKLEDAMLHFEAGHEKLMKQVRVIIDSLNEVGI